METFGLVLLALNFTSIIFCIVWIRQMFADDNILGDFIIPLLGIFGLSCISLMIVMALIETLIKYSQTLN